MSYAINCINLEKNYKNFSLKKLNFRIPFGKITGFIGENGNGKTTTIKCILNLIKYDAGEIYLFDKDSLKYESECKEKIGVVFDKLPFDECLNALQLSKILRYIYTYWDDNIFGQYLKKFKLPPKLQFKKYSSGMKTKLSLAVALSHQAQLLILDEPTNGLDPIFRKQLLDELIKFKQSNSNNAILFSTHIISDLDEIADNILFIHEGKIVFDDSKSNLYKYFLVIDGENDIVNKIDKSDIVKFKYNENGIKIVVKYQPQYLSKFNGKKATITDIMEIYSSNYD